MKKFILHLAMFSLPFALIVVSLSYTPESNAQTTSNIASGRPGIFIPPYVVGTGFVQLQSGLDLWKFETERNPDLFVESTQSNNFLRLGFNEWLETNLLVVYQSDLIRGLDSGEQDGVSQLVPGTRINLVNEDSGWIRGFGIQLSVSLKDVDEDYQSTSHTPSATFVSYHSLGSSLNLTNNLGLSYNTADGFVTSYNSAIDFALAKDLTGFVEIFGALYDNVPAAGSDKQTYTDAGIAYILNKDVQLDLSAGYGRNNAVITTFVSAGVSLRQQFWE